MTFEQALEAIKAGKKVARKVWGTENYLAASTGFGLIEVRDISGFIQYYRGGSYDLMADDWHVVDDKEQSESHGMTSDDYDKLQTEKKAKLVLTLVNTGRFSYGEAIDFAQKFDCIDPSEVQKYLSVKS